MPEHDLPHTFTAQGDTGVLYTVVRIPAEDGSADEPPSYALRDGSVVVALEDDLLRIETTGELLTPTTRASS